MATAQVSAVEAEVDMKMRADMEPALVGTATRLMAVMVGTVMTPMVPVMALIRAMGTVMRARVSAVEAMEMDMKLMRATAAMEMAISCDELGCLVVREQLSVPKCREKRNASCETTVMVCANLKPSPVESWRSRPCSPVGIIHTLIIRDLGVQKSQFTTPGLRDGATLLPSIHRSVEVMAAIAGTNAVLTPAMEVAGPWRTPPTTASHGNVRQISCTGPKSDLCGTRLSSSNFVGRGYHSIRIKAAAGPGVVSTFYLSNNGGLYDKTKTHPWVELDFEIMGNMAGGHSRIWTNMFTDIAVEHNDWITVPFDVSADVHEYGFELSDNSIAFKVDGVAYRTVDIRNHQEHRRLPRVPGGATASLCPFVATSWQRSPDLGRAMAWSPQLLRRARPGAGGGVAPRPRPPHEQVRGPLHFDMAAESDEDLEFDAPPHATTAQLLSTSDPEVIFMGSDEGLQDMDDDGPVGDSFGRPNLAPLHERFVDEMPDGQFDLFGDEPVHSRASRGDEQHQEEHAESEQPTNDPVLPDEAAEMPENPYHFEEEPQRTPVRPSRPPSMAASQRATPGPALQDPIDQLSKALAKLIKKGNSSEASWNSMMGPSKGIKFRGGAAPAPPKWYFNPEDVRAYDRYERKVLLWEMQARHFMSQAEIGLTLYASLQGEAEQQLEFLEMSEVYSKTGVKTILGLLKSAFQQKQVYVKRHYLHTYENISRFGSESLRTFINRYKRTELALKAVGVDIALSYDAEARGSRLLDRCRLSQDQQRLVLVGTNQDMSVDAIGSALVMQFPDYRPPPPIIQAYQSSKGPGGKGFPSKHFSSGTTSSSMSSASTAPTSASSYRKGDGKNRPRRVFQTVNETMDGSPDGEAEDPPAPEDPSFYFEELANEEDAGDDIDGTDDNHGAEDVEHLMQVLTVTARKLAAMNQGRKFRNAPKKSIEACTVSAKKGKGSGKSKAASSSSHVCVFGVRVLAADIPFLGSLSVMHKLSLTLDFANQIAVNMKSSFCHRLQLLGQLISSPLTFLRPSFMHDGPATSAEKSWASLVKRLIRLTMSVWTQMAASVKMGIMPLEQYKAMLAYGTKKLSKNANTGKGGQAKASKDKKIVPTPASPPPPSRPASSSQSYSTGAELMLAPPKGKTSKASRMGYAPTNPFGKTPTCNHPDFIRRYGNGWGNFARCKACYQRWRWNDAEGVWKSDGFCSKPSHSPQSPWTAVESITQVYAEPLMLVPEETMPDSSSAPRLRCPDGQRQHLRHPSQSQSHLKLGLRKRLSGNMAKNVKTLENEVNVLDHMPYKEIIKNKVDLLELYSGAARPTALAKQHGLTSLQPFEKDDGYDLNELYELRQADLDGLRFAIQRCLQQLTNGDLFFLENPLRSRLWDQPEVLRLAQHPDVIKGSCDSGAYGATDKDGYVIIKSFGCLTNSTEIANELSCRMTKEEKTQARPLEGQRVTDSQVYPVKMVHAMLRGLRAEAQRRYPARFQPVHWVLYAQPVHDEQRWTQALDMVKKLFGNTSARTITLKPSSEIYQIVSLKTDVSFPGLPAGIPREVQASVARLHVNAGHPARQEMIRLLTMHGAITSQILSCIDHLQCGSCKRTQLPQQSRPAAIPTMSGQFGDRLQIDRYWVRDLTGANHCFLGIVDMATNYQQTIRLTGQGAKDVYHALCQVWFKPFGHPLVIEADDDRNFEGEFKERIEGFGTHLLIAPAEAHWRIGSIERKNAILRSTMEKMIDEYGVTHPEMLDDIALAATQAINSSVTSKGRTPYQAVFGRLPRFPGDILGDERALLANYDAVYAEEMRSHALRIIAETRASHAVRRALLRKTAPSREEARAILPGSMAAYWRWQKKSKGRKRGGYVLARLMSHDPDNKSAWLHNGNSVVQATYEQIRPAFGIENWCPSSQDIQMLRDGSTRLQKGLWQDERGPPPPRLEAPAPEVELERAEPIPDLVMPLALKPSPATPAPIPKTPELPRPQPMVYSPTFKQQNVQANSMDETADRATYINSYISELLYEDYVLGQCHLAQLQVTDCRSLYDALLSPNPALSEKRTIITVRSIQEHVDAKSVRWTPTNVMWADCLTKASVELISTFQQWMEWPVCTIVDPKEKYTSVNFTVLHSPVWGKSASDPGEGIMEFRNAMGLLNGHWGHCVGVFVFRRENVCIGVLLQVWDAFAGWFIWFFGGLHKTDVRGRGRETGRCWQCGEP
ncbi:unnamed protein product [Durusdinium trenchii]|uniref:Uncharacterized protein n=1 Tax=Durusdinium trenchii TaxID=1381693 RepID=A0ABP0S663_9DINO